MSQDKTKENWSELINEDVSQAAPKQQEQEQTENNEHNNFYQQKYGESDYVLMFWNPSQPLEQWMVKDLLETVDVRARGIRVGRTGKCYADFENDEIRERVRELDGEKVGDVVITVSDVPSRVAKPTKSAPKKEGNDNRRERRDGERGRGSYHERREYDKTEERDGEKRSYRSYDGQRRERGEYRGRGGYRGRYNENRGYGENKRRYYNDRENQEQKVEEQREVKEEQKVEEQKQETKEVEIDEQQKQEQRQEEHRRYENNRTKGGRYGRKGNNRGNSRTTGLGKQEEIDWGSVMKSGGDDSTEKQKPKPAPKPKENTEDDGWETVGPKRKSKK